MTHFWILNQSECTARQGYYLIGQNLHGLGLSFRLNANFSPGWFLGFSGHPSNPGIAKLRLKMRTILTVRFYHFMGVMRARTASFVEKNHINKRWYHSLGHLKPTLKYYLHFKIGAKRNFMTKLLACGKDNHNNGIDSLMYEGFLSNKPAMVRSLPQE